MLVFPGPFYATSSRLDTSRSDRGQEQNQIRTRQSSQLYTPVTLTQLLSQSSVPPTSPSPFSSLSSLESGRFSRLFHGESHRNPTRETHQISRNPRGTRPERIAHGIKQLARDTFNTCKTVRAAREDL